MEIEERLRTLRAPGLAGGLQLAGQELREAHWLGWQQLSCAELARARWIGRPDLMSRCFALAFVRFWWWCWVRGAFLSFLQR